MSDIFKKYLNGGDSEYKKIALTTNSYRNINHSLTVQDTNCELATYGDALLKLALCKILFDEKVKNITVDKQKYETDKILVTVIAKHYDLLSYINLDEKDSNIHKDYNYAEPPKKRKDSPHKYIATTIEALLAAFYLDNEEKFDLIVEIVKKWRALIDEKCNTKT